MVIQWTEDVASGASDAAASTTVERDAPRQFWNHDTVPDESQEEFKRLIFQSPEYEQENDKGLAGQVFTPKDEHCGTWNLSPNSESHASFGDQGTTASVNCYGHLMQMSRFLGAGHSGMFSMDHRSAEEPYLVRSRAEDLDRFSRDKGDSLSYLLRLPPEFWPAVPPQVKWVNWRWPRYEYETELSKLKVSYQWVVHEGAVLQQIVLEAPGDKPIDFKYQFLKDIWVRDLDYLDPDYRFNYMEKGYSCVPGPNGYGNVCVSKLDVGSIRPEEDGVRHHTNDAPQATTMAQPSTPGMGQSLDAGTGVRNTLSKDQTDAPPANKIGVGDAQESEKTDQHIRSPDSVAAILSLFVNGNAVKIEDAKDHWYEPSFGNGPSSPNESVHGPIEIVVAYKLILLPGDEVDWRNFMVPAREADVSRILRDETDRLWENSELSSLCSLGLSFAGPRPEADSGGVGDVNDDGKTASGDQANAERGHLGARAAADEGKGPAASSETTDSPTNQGQNASKASSEPIGLSLPAGRLAQGSSPKSHIEYIAWRHLEHVLSVCAIPVSSPTLFEDRSHLGAGRPCAPHPASWEEEAPWATKDDRLVALTCGDMSGHRICTSASFFAFQFLVEVAKRLAHHPNQIPYIKILQVRIKQVLRGHIKWLESLRTLDQPPLAGTSPKLLKSGCYAANYWVTGQIERSENSDSWQPNNSVTDTPYHVLKLVEYMKFCKEYDRNRTEAKGLVCRILRDIWVPWFYELDKLDKRTSFAWPHATDEGVDTYRLADHFWVWKALKALEDSGMSNHQPPMALTEGQILWKDEEKWKFHLYGPNALIPVDQKQAHKKFGQVAKRMLPSDAQRAILQRFTTENDIPRKRMLAVTRSPRENRFLLHARDTALFYGQDCHFFLPGSSFQELWANTVEIQPYHDENQDTGWDNTIRYALGIVAGCRNSTLNKRSPKELVRKCVDVLIHSSSHNGFFPGQLDEATKEPNLFYDEEERDFYYHAGFEVSYILLTHARAIDECFEVTTKTSSQQPKSASTASSGGGDNDSGRYSLAHSPKTHIATEPTAHPEAQNPENQRPDDRLSPGVRQIEPDRHVDRQRSWAMKKVVPFNSLIDATSIIAIEEEWLYRYPPFFPTAKVDIVEQINKLLDPPRSRESDEDESSISPTSQPSGEALGVVIGQELDGYRSTQRRFSMPNGLKSFESTAFIADTPKQKHLGKRERKSLEVMDRVPALHNMDLFASLTSPRTAQQAKKRFLWLPHANAETALLCWAASPEQERAAISLFFDRHSKYEKYVWDDTTMVLNTWKTELHLSFYVLVDTSTPRHVGLPPPTADLLPGELRREIRRASMSFRFDGDFFDRYWTCHFVEHVPNKLHQVEWSLPFDASGKNVDKQWWQRKVLELFLLNDILCEVDDGAMEVLSQVRKELGVEESSLSFSILDSEAYSSSKDNWHRFEQILHAVEEDLTSILNTLQKWTSRERDRGQEKPRWTRSDERKYRGAINKYRGATERQIRDLGMHRDTIRKLKDTLATSRQKIRDDRELHRNENIRYFTYVTVIFLPLGFAASFYSMNGAPENDLLSSLIKFAAGAFAVTVALLASAKTLFLAVDVLCGPLRRMRSKAGLAIEKYSRSTREESWLMKHRMKPGESDEQGKGSPPPPPSRAKASGQEHIAHDDVNRRSLSPILFWPAYIFIEIPARRVLVAIFELKSGSLSPQAIAHIIAGVVLVPVFGLSWLVKVIFVNIQDVVEFLKHIGDLIPKWSTSSKPRNKDDDAAAFLRRFEQMTNTPEASRPLKMLQERMNRKLKTSTTAQED